MRVRDLVGLLCSLDQDEELFLEDQEDGLVSLDGVERVDNPDGGNVLACFHRRTLIKTEAMKTIPDGAFPRKLNISSFPEPSTPDRPLNHKVGR